MSLGPGAHEWSQDLDSGLQICLTCTLQLFPGNPIPPREGDVWAPGDGAQSSLVFYWRSLAAIGQPPLCSSDLVTIPVLSNNMFIIISEVTNGPSPPTSGRAQGCHDPWHSLGAQPALAVNPGCLGSDPQASRGTSKIAPPGRVP